MFASNIIIAVNANSLLTEQDGKGHYTDANYCGESSSEAKLYLYDNDFRDNNMFRLWQTAVAGAVFTGIPTVFCFCALTYMCVFPSPDRRHFDADFDYRNRYYCAEHRKGSRCWETCYFPDYEETAPRCRTKGVVDQRGSRSLDQNPVFDQLNQVSKGFNDAGPTHTQNAKNPFADL